MNPRSGRSTAGTPSTSQRMRIRPAIAQDRDFAMSLVPLLVSSTSVPWRSPRKLFAAYVEVISSILRAPRTGAALLVAEDADSAARGCVLLTEATDCYTHRRQGHLAQVAIAKDLDRSIDALALLRAATAWARARGYIVLTADGFWIGHPAMALATTTVGRRTVGCSLSGHSKNPSAMRSRAFRPLCGRVHLSSLSRKKDELAARSA